MFDLFNESTPIHKIKKSSKSSTRELKKELRLKARDQNCIDAIKENGLPLENEVQSFVSRGMSDAGSFINAILEYHEVIEEAVIATWTISRRNVEKLINLVDTGKIEKLSFLINDGLLKTNSTKSIYAYMCLEFDKRDNITYNVANSHAKIQCYKCGDSYYTISGSGNWSENPRIENYVLIGGEEMFNFNKEWITLNLK